MAISFGHKDNQWRSKYSFKPKAMMNSSRNLLSKGELTDVYKHNEGDVNSFYGVKSNSVLGVAFNDNPSSNKVFKSISLEGSDILKTKRHDFAASTSTESPSQNKYYLTSKGKNMGGIIYNTLGKSDVIVNGTSMHYVGDVTSVNDIAINEEVSDVSAMVDVDTSYSTYSPVSNLASRVKYGFYLPDEGKFYFGSDIVTSGGGGDGDGDGGGGVVSEEFDNCDTLQLYQESQFYEVIFYPDTGYLHLYIPNNVPVGDHTYINSFFIVNGVEVSGQYVDETTDYYDPFRWSWRVFIGEPASVSIFLSSYSGNFLDGNGNPLEGYDDNGCTFGFGSVSIQQGDIDPSVACDQLATSASYSVTPPTIANNDAAVTVTFSGDVLQDPEFTSEASYIYLYNALGDDIVQPSSISYTEGVGTEVTFSGLEPTESGQVSWALYFSNGDCDQIYVPWSQSVVVNSNEAADECLATYEELPALFSEVFGAPSDVVAPGSPITIGTSLSQNTFTISVNSAILSQGFNDVGNTNPPQEVIDAVWGVPFGQNITMTIVKYDSSNDVETVIPMEITTNTLSTVDLMVWSCPYEQVTSGEWRIHLDIGSCTASLSSLPGGLNYNNYFANLGGFWIATFDYVQTSNNCDNIFPSGQVFPYSKWESFENTFKEVSTSGSTSSTTGNVNFTVYVGPTFSVEDFVLFIGNRTTNEIASGQLPSTNESVSVDYVQDGGQNFSNSNDISSVWTYDGDYLYINVSGIPMDPSFEIGVPETYTTYYDWAIISKTCINPDSVDNDYWRNQAPWNTDYGILGNVVTDSLSDSPIGGPIAIGGSGLVDEEPEAGELVLDEQYFADFNQDGQVGSADLLDFLAYFGEEGGYSHTVVETSTGNSVDVNYDIDGDASVGVSDILQFLSVYGAETPYNLSNGLETVENPPTAARASKTEDLIPLADLASGNYGLSDIPSSITATGQGVFEYTATSPSTANLGIQSFSPDVITYIKSEGFPSNAQLFAFIDPEISGDDLRGQTAELLLDLGQEDFELFAVNLNYELLNADHTK